MSEERKITIEELREIIVEASKKMTFAEYLMICIELALLDEKNRAIIERVQNAKPKKIDLENSQNTGK